MSSHTPPDGMADDFFEQMLSMSMYGSAASGVPATPSHLGSTGESSVFPLGLSLEQGNGTTGEESEGKGQVKREERDSVQLSNLSPMLRQIQAHQLGPNPSQIFQGQAAQEAVAAPTHLPAARPKVRARRGQATDPHSIAERLRRERITERFRALQELLPNINKTDRAVMLDEVVDYVKFLRLQVKILSMSRIGGGGGSMAQIVADIPFQSLEGEVADGGNKQQFWEKWSDDGTEHQVAKLMEEDIGAALQVLQSKALCIMPISLATTIYPSNYKVEDAKVEPDDNTPS